LTQCWMPDEGNSTQRRRGGRLNQTRDSILPGLSPAFLPFRVFALKPVFAQEEFAIFIVRSFDEVEHCAARMAHGNCDSFHFPVLIGLRGRSERSAARPKLRPLERHDLAITAGAIALRRCGRPRFRWLALVAGSIVFNRAGAIRCGRVRRLEVGRAAGLASGAGKAHASGDVPDSGGGR